MLSDAKGLSPQRPIRLPILSAEDLTILAEDIIPGSKLKWRRKYLVNPPNVMPNAKHTIVPDAFRSYLEETERVHLCFNRNCNGKQIFRFKPNKV